MLLIVSILFVCNVAALSGVFYMGAKVVESDQRIEELTHLNALYAENLDLYSEEIADRDFDIRNLISSIEEELGRSIGPAKNANSIIHKNLKD